MMTGVPAFPSIYALRQSVDFLLGVDIGRMDEQLKRLDRVAARGRPATRPRTADAP